MVSIKKNRLSTFTLLSTLCRKEEIEFVRKLSFDRFRFLSIQILPTKFPPKQCVRTNNIIELDWTYGNTNVKRNVKFKCIVLISFTK